MKEQVKERPEARRCTTCGRPTWSAAGICFACRRPTPDVAEIPAPPVLVALEPEVEIDGVGRIVEDVGCAGCGYNLRGLPTTIGCPECSTPVGRSIQGNRLKFSDPAWVGRLTAGLRLVIAGILVGVVAGIAVAFVVGWLAATGTMSFAGATTIGGFVNAGLATVMAVGVWMVTTPDPARAGRFEAMLSARRLARWCVMAEIAAAPLDMFVNVSAGMGFPMAGVSPVLMGLAFATMLLGLVSVIGQAAGLMYLGTLASRIPRASLARRSRMVAWGYALCLGAGLIVGVASTAIIPGAMGAGAPTGLLNPVIAVIMLLGCSAGVGMLVFGIWAIVLLFLHAVVLSRVLAEARARWEVELTQETPYASPHEEWKNESSNQT